MGTKPLDTATFQVVVAKLGYCGYDSDHQREEIKPVRGEYDIINFACYSNSTFLVAKGTSVFACGQFGRPFIVVIG